jgi:apolipoprotein N-acyltransferase
MAPTSTYKSLLWGLFSGLLTALLWVISIPPFDCAEAAYIAFVPLLLWLYSRPSWRCSLLVALGCGWISWCVILIWLRHVTVVGTLSLALVLAVIFMLWLALARWIVPTLGQRKLLSRFLCFAGLAGAWVLLEWTRSWLFWGFPWAPLALSQWQRTVILQIAAWSGAYGVSFVLVLFNCCVAHTLYNRVIQRAHTFWSGWLSPDLYLAILTLSGCIYLFFQSLPPSKSTQPLFTAAVVQPYILPTLKWDTQLEQENFAILAQQTRLVSILESDLILWPEAATPWPIIGYPQMQQAVELLASEVNHPILMGNIAWHRTNDRWHNGACLVDPNTGLSGDFYIKRELVPFGEYVPAGFGFLQKFVPIGGNFIAGQDAGLISFELAGRSIQIAPLVCYEDSFPKLARQSAQAGADVFFVATNNAWYGEEGGASQHAAHSVLRAVETRRPVMRAGNGGWSGWIDSYGNIRSILQAANGSVYFRGGGSYDVFQYKKWHKQQSYYTRQGNWFVLLSAGFTLTTMLLMRQRRHWKANN